MPYYQRADDALASHDSFRDPLPSPHHRRLRLLTFQELVRFLTRRRPGLHPTHDTRSPISTTSPEPSGLFPFRSTAPHPMDFHTYTLNSTNSSPPSGLTKPHLNPAPISARHAAAQSSTASSIAPDELDLGRVDSNHRPIPRPRT